MFVLTVVCVVVISAWVLRALRGTLDVADVAVGLTIPTIVGFLLLNAGGAASVGATARFVVLTSAFWVAAAWPRRPSATHDVLTPRDRRAAWILVVAAALGSAYHFAAGGVPLFEPNIDLSRFDFTSSGFFGIPGRFYLYGVPASVFAAFYARSRAQGWRRDPLVLTSLVVLVTTRVLGGFKGGMVEAAEVVLIAGLINGERITFRQLSKRYAPLVPTAIAGVFLIGSLYPSYRATGAPLTSILQHRITTVAAAPPAEVFDHRLPVPLASTALYKNDIRYYAEKYFHIGPGAAFPFERDVSAGLLGGDPSATYFLPPVTVTAAAELFAALGVAGAVAAMATLGVCTRRASTHPARTWRSAVGRGLFLFGVLGFVQRGALVYYAVNLGCVYAGMVALGILGEQLALTSPVRSRASGASGVYT